MNNKKFAERCAAGLRAMSRPPDCFVASGDMTDMPTAILGIPVMMANCPPTTDGGAPVIPAWLENPHMLVDSHRFACGFDEWGV